MREFTSEQRQAIEAKGKTIVSASAGSGKTTVMIEKILRMIQTGTDVSEILAVTYTKKAAAQMKDKLRRELMKAIADPNTDNEVRKRLKGQLPKIASADISTVHSFCTRLIRSHFYLTDVDADFSVTTGEGADSELFDRAMDSLFEEGYEKGEEDFKGLLSVYFKSKKDDTLKQIIKSLYSSVRIHADYKQMLSEKSVVASEEKFDEICTELLRLLHEKCDYLFDKIWKEERWFSLGMYLPSVKNARELLDALTSLKHCKDYFEACSVPCPKFSNRQTKKKNFPPEFEDHTTVLAAYKKAVQKIFEELSKTKGREEEKASYFNAGKTSAALAKYTLLFDEKYSQVKRERNLLDYSDLEHVALQLLSDESVAEEIKNKYAYVFVDEYQDVNPVQEKIINAVSRDNVFLVGDVKQAIYGFRGGKSAYFVEKQRLFEQEKNAKSLYMTRNFRSVVEVLNSVNAVFSRAMKKDVSEVAYRQDSVMIGGGRYADNRGKVAVHFFLEEKAEKLPKERRVYSVEEHYLQKRKETSLFAERVRQLIEKERSSVWFDADENKTKRVEYSDIAFLTRKNRGVVEKVVEAMTEAGIPVTASSETNIFAYPEIKTLTDILKLLDNSKQDIPLCSALLSPLGDCSADELTTIRLAYPNEKFYRTACERYASEQTDELSGKLRDFFAYFGKLKSFAAVSDSGEVLTKLLSETNMEARLLSKDNGAGCLRRIRYFISQTTQGEPLDVHAFLEYLKASDYYIPYKEASGENTVKVMTMHASKGLEFPVVIVGDLSKEFAGADEKNFQFDERYGIATKCYDKEAMTYCNTLLWRLCKQREQTEEIKNELNLFYVALTRAKYSLHAVFGKPIKFFNPRYATTFADFVDFRVWKKFVQEDDSFDVAKAERTALVSEADEKLVDKLTSLLEWKYPFTGGENLQVKTSATARMNAEREDKEYYDVPVLFDEKAEEENEKTGSDKQLEGLAYHAFLQTFPFERWWKLQKEEKDAFVLQAKEELIREGKLSSEYANALTDEGVLQALNGRVFEEIKGYTLHREQEFLAALPAEEVYRNVDLGACGKEKILFQGAIDLLALQRGKAWIVDYKYSNGQSGYLKEKYALQLTLYKKAVAAITGIAEEDIRTTIVNIKKGCSVEV